MFYWKIIAESLRQQKLFIWSSKFYPLKFEDSNKFNSFITCPDEEMERTILKFVDNTKFREAVTTLEERNTIQRDFDMFEKWAKKPLKVRLRQI